MLITIIFLIVLFALIAKAIFETIWGTCLVIYGLICYALGCILEILVFLLGLSGKIKRMFRQKPQPAARRVSVAGAFAKVYGSSK